ncbi:uncharacterized protein LY89DRAFT_595255 [Mollisia scopiformis]|uniref:GRF-type domain-containing protein n=1 Tax=Mollisia scopiformis TaxID=149040 RepID=A0A194WU92_MOLSC|nr:uncharacterized protein LY89DRAFT_595255 [Mollisia scopiformis]KUJ11244.1 hypothetical protein LY89DRAFT_595255 [Mollisia scopiformis]
MFTTPKKPRGSYTPYSSSPSKVRLNGLFADGIWQCSNCNPRLPAAHFQVKKDGPNQGNWFYTCQESRDNGCGFFLWDDKAAGREMRAVIGNTRSAADAARDKRTIEGHSAASNKFMADLAKANEDEFGDFSLSAEDEQKLVDAVEEADAGEYPQTPRKAIKTSEFMTTGSKRKRDEDTLPTPNSGSYKPNMANSLRKDEDVFNTPSSRLKGGMWDGHERLGLRSPSATPTPSRFQDPSTDDNSPSKTTQNCDISEEVLELLKSQHIDEEASSNLRTLLSKHALKISGIVKGRDITRMALKTKDAKIAELQQKITALEAEREMDKTVIRHFKADMAHSVEKRRGRGRGKT